MTTYTNESEFTTPGTSARVWLVLQVDVVSQDIALNQTTLNWYVRGEERITNASPYNLTAGRSGSATVGSSVWSTSTSTYDFRASFATNYWASGTTVITHDADGTKTITLAASYDSNDSVLGTASFSVSQALPTIPRATVPTVSPTSGNTGSTYTITHTPATSTFYHDVAYSLTGIGGSYTDIQTNIVGTDTSTDWTPAHTLLPNTTGLTAYIRVITRSSSGGTIIGTEYVALPLTVPSSVKPTISSVAWVDNQISSPDMPTLMGAAGRFVQGWSKLKPTVTAAGSGGSTIVSTMVTQNGQTTNSGTAFTSAIALSGSVPFSAETTDSRGRVNDAYASTVAVTAYSFPNLPTPTVTRTSDAGGTIPSPTGTYLKITPNASVSSLNFSGEKNLLEYQIRTSLKGVNSWTTKVSWTAVAGTTWTAASVISTYLSSAEYDVEISIRDLFGKNGYDTSNTVKTLIVVVPSESVDIDFNQGVGFGFNKYHSGSGAFIQVDGGVDVVGNIEGDTITQAGLAVIDTGDTASTIAAGIQENATDAEAIAKSSATRTVTASNLAALGASDTFAGFVELATTGEAVTGTDTSRAVTAAGLAAALEDRPGWQRVVPTSIASSGSTATYNSTTGLITMPAACTMVRANGVFVAGYEYLIVTKEVDAFTASTDQMLMRFTTSGTANTTAVYYTVGRYTQYDGTAGNWIINAGTYASMGIGYTAGGEARREWQIIGAFETLNTFIKQQWSYVPGSARETVSSGSFNQTTSFDGFQIYSATGSFQGTMQVWRRKAMAL